MVEEVFVNPDIEKYIVSIVNKTRDDHRIAVGASPRGSLALLKLARARAGQNGRDFVLPDDIKHFAVPSLSHRIILEPDLWMKKRAAEDIIQSISDSVPVPVYKDDAR